MYHVTCGALTIDISWSRNMTEGPCLNTPLSETHIFRGWRVQALLRELSGEHTQSTCQSCCRVDNPSNDRLLHERIRLWLRASFTHPEPCDGGAMLRVETLNRHNFQRRSFILTSYTVSRENIQAYSSTYQASSFRTWLIVFTNSLQIPGLLPLRALSSRFFPEIDINFITTQHASSPTKHRSLSPSTNQGSRPTNPSIQTLCDGANDDSSSS